MCSLCQTGSHMHVNRRRIFFSSRGIRVSVSTLFTLWKHIPAPREALPVTPQPRSTNSWSHSTAGGLRSPRRGCPPPHWLPASAVQSQPCQCHTQHSVPEKGTQPYTVPARNSQTFQNPQAPFTQAPRSLATSIRCIWSLSGLPWAKNLVWNSFSLQHFGSSASGAI